MAASGTKVSGCFLRCHGLFSAHMKQNATKGMQIDNDIKCTVQAIQDFLKAKTIEYLMAKSVTRSQPNRAD